MTSGTATVTSHEAARLLGKSVKTVHRMADRGELPVARKLPGLRGAYLFDRQAIEALRDQAAPAVTDNHTYQDTEAAS